MKQSIESENPRREPGTFRRTSHPGQIIPRFENPRVYYRNPNPMTWFQGTINFEHILSNGSSIYRGYTATPARIERVERIIGRLPGRRD